MVTDHPILFRGLTFDAGSGRLRPSTESRPVLVERTDEDFVAAFLDELRSDEGRKRLARSVRNAGEPSKGLKLLQPVHRTFNLAVLEVACDIFGEPRLDPASIDSAGMVVRRRNPTTGKLEGWMKLGGEVHGWLALDDPQKDPDPARRGQPFKAGDAELSTRLQQTMGAPLPFEESVSLLFQAPPDICAATHRTVLYGMVPVSSSETVSGAVRPPPTYEEAEIRDMLMPYFSASIGVSLKGLAGKRFTRNYREELLKDTSFSSQSARAEALERLEQFINLLRKLVSVFNAFEHAGLKKALNGLSFELEPKVKRPVGDVLERATDIFVFERLNESFLMPKEWPNMPSSYVSSLVRAAADASNVRLKSLLPRRGRFDMPGARYEVHAFVRVRRADGCPPVIKWTAKPSQSFEIANWYESSKLPPIQVALPPVTRKNVGSFLPNVAFAVPKNIFNLLAINKPEDFLESKAKEGSSSGPDWICGFNIPIITLCAFIVLSIFLSLLNIVFWWIALIKICIPVPRRWNA
jgi:hypothetical protein